MLEDYKFISDNFINMPNRKYSTILCFYIFSKIIILKYDKKNLKSDQLYE